MKMRNTIRAAREAIVTEVAVAPGAGVSSGDVLVRFGAPTG
jgi:biotin carboxyl carrier protein